MGWLFHDGIEFRREIEGHNIPQRLAYHDIGEVQLFLGGGGELNVHPGGKAVGIIFVVMMSISMLLSLWLMFSLGGMQL